MTPPLFFCPISCIRSKFILKSAHPAVSFVKCTYGVLRSTAVLCNTVPSTMHIRSKRKKLCTMMYKVTLCGCIYWLATPLHTTLAVTCCHSESPVACSWGLELQRPTALLCIVVLHVILLLTSAEWWIEGIELLQTYKDTLLWLNAETLERVPTPFFGELVS